MEFVIHDFEIFYKRSPRVDVIGGGVIHGYVPKDYMSYARSVVKQRPVTAYCEASAHDANEPLCETWFTKLLTL